MRWDGVGTAPEVEIVGKVELVRQELERWQCEWESTDSTYTKK